MDDEVADYLGTHALAQNSLRLARLLWMWGPPHMFIFAHHPIQNVVKHWFRNFQWDVGAYPRLEALRDKAAAQIQVLRIVFTLVHTSILVCLFVVGVLLSGCTCATNAFEL